VPLRAKIKITIHKAIDQTNSPLAEIKNLKSIQNVSSVLSSGKGQNIFEGIDMLKLMKNTASERITIILQVK